MNISEELKDALEEVFNIGVGRASKALSELLSKPLKLTVPQFHIYSISEMRNYVLHLKKEAFVKVTQKFFGSLSGEGNLSFPLKNGKTLVDLLMEKTEGSDESFGAIQIEAIQEVGNMVINAVGSVISDMTKIQLNYSLPEVSFEKSLFTIAQTDECDGNQAYCFATAVFVVEGIDIEGNIYFFFSKENMGALETYFSNLRCDQN